MTPKRKKIGSPDSNSKAAFIVIGLFAAVVIAFFIFSKGKEAHKEKTPAPKEAVEVSSPVENNIPVEEPRPQVPPEAPEPEYVPGTGDKIAIIIDDWGQSIAPCKYLKEIHAPLAVSILPGLRHTKDVANCAKLYHKLVMLHLPLQALYNGDYYPPNYIIKTTMDPSLVTKIVNEDLDQLPALEGVNNHMGSKATEDKPLMRLIFKIIKKRKLFFVDSMTAPHSVCTPLADEIGIAFGKRDIFLDNKINREYITEQFVNLARKARRKGYAVAIGHAFNPLTMEIIKEQIPLLEKQGFKIVSIKELLINK